jgi:DNA-binding NarL/FixJ family response regulator
MNSFFKKYFKKPQELKRITVIHCDDHELFRFGVRSVLEKYSDIEFIGEAGNGLELLKLLETVIPDIVILNVAMPVMDGIQTLPKIREKYPGLRVVVLSMHNSPLIITKMMQLGANSYLTKNTEGEIIYRAIKCVHEFDYYYSESIEHAYLGSSLEFDRIGRKYSDKELMIIKFIKENKSKREIGEILDIGESTVSAILERISRNRFK